MNTSGEKHYWSRSKVIPKKAIILAKYKYKYKYKCEFEDTHMFFTSKTTGENYVEAHHLIPMEFQQETRAGPRAS